jgi:pyruvate dehydrogenase E1 component beta subunit/2-oxoisovalerate dehydrogenase E1 component beta subunit
MSIAYLDAIREAQAAALRENSRVYLYGQDIGRFGGAFKATKNLAQEFPGRVLDSPISEDAMIGAAVGSALEGMRPIVEMQFADFSLVAFNQIVNQAATMFWRTGTPCPITIRLPSGGNPGTGPFHSQSLESLYAHFPGLVVVTPATVEDAYWMLLDAVSIDDPVIFLRAQASIQPPEDRSPAP